MNAEVFKLLLAGNEALTLTLTHGKKKKKVMQHNVVLNQELTMAGERINANEKSDEAHYCDAENIKNVHFLETCPPQSFGFWRQSLRVNLWHFETKVGH